MENSHLENFRKMWSPKNKPQPNKPHNNSSNVPVGQYQTLGEYLNDVAEFGDIPEEKQDFSFGVKNYGQGLSVDGKNLVLTLTTMDLKRMGQGAYEREFLLEKFSQELHQPQNDDNSRFIMSQVVLSRLFTQALEDAYGYEHGDFSKSNHSIECLSQVSAHGTILTAMKFTIAFDLFDISYGSQDGSAEKISKLPPMNKTNRKIMNLPLIQVKDFFAPTFFVFNNYIQSGEIFDEFFKISDTGIDYYGKDFDSLAYVKLGLGE